MKRRKTFAASLLLAATFTPSVYASGIPTLDINSIAQLKVLQEQVQTAMQQLNQAKAQLAALTQSSGFGYVLNNPGVREQLRGALPADANALLDRMGNDNSGMSGAVDDIIKDVNASVNFPEDRTKLAERKINIDATAKALSQRAYDSMTKRLEVLDGLQAKINETTNPKEIAELQARIAIEQANVQTDQTRIELAKQQLDAERALLNARAERVYGGWFGNSEKQPN